MLKDVKIWFGDPSKTKEAMDYLESMGYDPKKNNIDKEVPNNYMGGLSGDNEGYITYISGDFSGKNYFDDYKAEEIFLNGKKAPPIGLRPKAIVDALRIKEILEAMTRYSDDGQKIPQEWLDELSIINSEKV